MNRRNIVAVLLVVACASVSVASESPLVVHGSAGWSYRVTDGNDYLGGDNNGAAENFIATLVADYTPMDAFGFHIQGFVEKDGVTLETNDGFDFAFVEWKYADALRVRAGLVKQPFGLHNELTRIGIARPTLDLPAAIYGDSGFVDEGYLGLGITGSKSFDNDWELSYDVYGGELESRFAFGLTLFDILPLGFVPPGWPDEAVTRTDISLEELVGGRFNAITPGGTEFGFSIYTGMMGVFYDGGSEGRNNVFGLHFKTERGKSSFSAEYLHGEASGIYACNAAYVEYAHILNDKLQAVVTYETQTLTSEDADESVAPSIFDHGALGIGLAFRLSPKAVIKVGGQWISGNRFAMPDTISEIFADGFDDKTTSFTMGFDLAF
jgi:hypothetical protein